MSEHTADDLYDCDHCGTLIDGRHGGGKFDSGLAYCKECDGKYPPALLKAESDSYCYGLLLTDGTHWFFESCTIHGDWVHLREARENQFIGKPIYSTRGIDIPLSRIALVYDTDS